ncbi:MAG: hypothetical protein KAY37_04445 [Phycisphaerae bacterium]|nr:hypothetical protein [Phycisphaerae bacterium]
MPQGFTSGAKARAETIRREKADKEMNKGLVKDRARRQKKEDAWHADLQNERDAAFKKQNEWLKKMERTRVEREKADNDYRAVLRGSAKDDEMKRNKTARFAPTGRTPPKRKQQVAAPSPAETHVKAGPPAVAAAEPAETEKTPETESYYP